MWGDGVTGVLSGEAGLWMGGNDGSAHDGLRTAALPAVLSAATVLDGDTEQRADVGGDVRGKHGVGEEFNQIRQDGIVPRLGAEAGGGKQPLTVDHWEGQGVGDGEDRIALWPAGARLEARNGAGIEAGALRQLGLGPAAGGPEFPEQGGKVVHASTFVVGRGSDAIREVRSPPVEDIWLAFFVAGAITELYQREAATLVEGAGAGVPLEGPETEAIRALLHRPRQEAAADPLALRCGQHVELFQHIAVECGNTDNSSP